MYKLQLLVILRYFTEIYFWGGNTFAYHRSTAVVVTFAYIVHSTRAFS